MLKKIRIDFENVRLKINLFNDTLSIFITLNVPNTLREQKFIQNIQLDSQQNSDVNIVNILSSSLRVPITK